jgi:hypothetical protein
VLFPLLRKCTEKALMARDTSLVIVARQLGPWVDCLREAMKPGDLRWFLDAYRRILDFAWQFREFSQKK